MSLLQPSALQRKAQLVWIQVSSSTYFSRAAVIIALQLLSSIFYFLSLTGGSIEWVKEHLSELGTHFLLSVILFCTAFILTVTLPTRKARVLAMIGHAAILILQFLWDRGDNFEKHGSYNALLFIVMTFVILSVALSIMLCYNLTSRKDLFFKVLIITIVIVVSLVTWRLLVWREVWGHGLVGKKLDRTTASMCSFESRGNLPFVDLLPNGIQNFWTGSQTCPKQAFSIDAKIDVNGILSIHCTRDQGKAFYTLLPNTIPFGAAEKLQDVLPITVSKKSVRKQYTQPTLLPEDQETVLVHCGEITELRTNIQISKRIRQHLYTSEMTPGNDSSTPTPKKPVNALILFFDAVSRRHMLRKLPKTMEILASLHSPTADENGKMVKAPGNDGLRLFQFFRYHVTGFNTDPNTRVMYAGDIKKDNKSVALAEDVFMSNFRDSNEKSKYMVARAETNCEDWSTQYEGKAASNVSFDHEFISPMCHESYFSHDGHPFGNFRGPYSILRRCLHGRYVHSHTLDYLRGLERKYRTKAPGVPWVMFGSFIEGHEGTGEVLSTLDEDLAEYLLQLAAEGTFKDTALFLIADHGLHMGLNFVYSMNGVIEHANPALFALLPERILNEKTLANLLHNEQALVTAYNVHHTWRDILGLSGFEKTQSLLQNSIPYDLDCEQANINKNLCQCK